MDRYVLRSLAGSSLGIIMATTVLLIILIAVLLAVLPVWPYSRTWGPFPSGLVGMIIVILLVLLVLGKV